jgi:hypothetical protein
VRTRFFQKPKGFPEIISSALGSKNRSLSSRKHHVDVIDRRNLSELKALKLKAFPAKKAFVALKGNVYESGCAKKKSFGGCKVAKMFTNPTGL